MSELQGSDILDLCFNLKVSKFDTGCCGGLGSYAVREGSCFITGYIITYLLQGHTTLFMVLINLFLDTIPHFVLPSLR